MKHPSKAPAVAPDMRLIGRNEHGHWEATNRKDLSVMVLIPAAEFLMGEGTGDIRVHAVHIDAFWMDRHLVTIRRYGAFLEETGHRGPPSWDLQKSLVGEQPVTDVAWRDAAAYCRWAANRLPTEAEWEKAARGGLQGKAFPWGDEAATGRACYRTSPGRPVPVGTYAANGFGLFDMAGNVWEWCSDWWASRYYAKSPNANPRGPQRGRDRVVRGGAFDYSDFFLRCACRVRYRPMEHRNIGFRCVRSAGSREA